MLIQISFQKRIYIFEGFQLCSFYPFFWHTYIALDINDIIFFSKIYVIYKIQLLRKLYLTDK